MAGFEFILNLCLIDPLQIPLFIMDNRNIDIVKETESWMDIEGVNGIAESKREGIPCLIVYTSVDVEKIRNKLPETIHGYKVIIEEEDEFSAL